MSDADVDACISACLYCACTLQRTGVSARAAAHDSDEECACCVRRDVCPCGCCSTQAHRSAPYNETCTLGKDFVSKMHYIRISHCPHCAVAPREESDTWHRIVRIAALTAALLLDLCYQYCIALLRALMQ